MQVAETFTAEFSAAILKVEGAQDGDGEGNSGASGLDEDDRKVLEEMCVYPP